MHDFFEILNIPRSNVFSLLGIAIAFLAASFMEEPIEIFGARIPPVPTRHRRTISCCSTIFIVFLALGLLDVFPENGYSIFSCYDEKNLLPFIYVFIGIILLCTIVFGFYSCQRTKNTNTIFNIKFKQRLVLCLTFFICIFTFVLFFPLCQRLINDSVYKNKKIELTNYIQIYNNSLINGNPRSVAKQVGKIENFLQEIEDLPPVQKRGLYNMMEELHDDCKEQIQYKNNDNSVFDFNICPCIKLK